MMVFVVMLAEHIDFFSGVLMTPMPLSAFIAFCILTLLCFIIYFYFETKVNKIKPNFFVIVVICLLFVSGLIGIWFNSGTAFLVDGTEFSTSIPYLDKIVDTLTLGFGVLGIYVILVIYPKNQIDSRKMYWFYYIIALIGLISLIYSLSVEFDLYLEIFRGDIGGSNNVSIVSFYNNENTYSVMMMLAFIAIAIINFSKTRWWNYLLMIVFFTGLFFATSLTCITLTIIFSGIYFIVSIINFVKKGNKGQIIAHALTFPLAIILLFIIFITLYLCEVGPIVKIFNFVSEFVLKKDFSTFSSRFKVWENAISTLNSPLDWIFGKGYKTFNSVISYRFSLVYGRDNPYVDNGFIQVLGSFGLIGLLFYVALIVFVIYMFAFCSKKGKFSKVAVPFSGFILMVGHCFFENTIMLDFDTKGMVVTMMFIMPLLIEYNAAKHSEVIQYYEEVNIPVKKYFHSKNFAILLAATSLAICVSLLSSTFILIPKLPVMENLLFIFLIVSSILLAFFLTGPFLIRIWAIRNTNKTLATTIAINVIALLGLSSLIGVTFGILADSLLVGIFFFLASFLSILMLQVLIYGTRYGYMREYARYMRGMFLSTIVNTVVSIVVFGGVMFGLSYLLPFNALFFVVSILIFVVLYLCSLIIFPNRSIYKKKWKDLLNFYNDAMLKNIQNNLLKNKNN